MIQELFFDCVTVNRHFFLDSLHNYSIHITKLLPVNNRKVKLACEIRAYIYM